MRLLLHVVEPATGQLDLGPSERLDAVVADGRQGLGQRELVAVLPRSAQLLGRRLGVRGDEGAERELDDHVGRRCGRTHHRVESVEEIQGLLADLVLLEAFQKAGLAVTARTLAATCALTLLLGATDLVLLLGAEDRLAVARAVLLLGVGTAAVLLASHVVLALLCRRVR